MTATLILSGALDHVEWGVLDAAQRSLVDTRPVDRPVEIIGIDQQSLDEVAKLTGFTWPWPRAFYGRIVDVLKAARARTVVFDMMFFEADLERPEFPEGTADEAFAEACVAHGSVVLASALGLTTSRRRADSRAEELGLPSLDPRACVGRATGEPLSASLPIEVLASCARDVGAANLEPDADGVMRRLSPTHWAGEVCVPSLALAATRAYLAGPEDELPGVVVEEDTLVMGGRTFPLDGDGRLHLNWYGRGGPRADGAGTYRYTPIFDLLLASLDLESGDRSRVDLAPFAGKVVLIGSVAPGLMDLKPSPMASRGPYPGVEIVATAVENFISGRALRRPGPGVIAAIAATLALVVGLLSWMRAGLLWNVTMTFGVALIYLVAALVALAQGRVALSLVGPSSACFAAGLVSLGWQYLTEGERRRHIKAMFQNYVSTPVVDQLMRDPESLRLGGERREMTVFFSDIAGYTAVSESMAPEKLVAQLNNYLTEVGKPILAHAGYVDKYIGDAVMAIFGAPVPHDDKAANAVFAALEIQRRLDALRPQWEFDFKPPMDTRIGIATGAAVLGNIGSAVRMNYTAIGDTVNLAARLEGANKTFDTRVLVCGRTRELVGDRVQFRELGSVAVKGKRQSVPVHEALALAGEPCPLPEPFLAAYQGVVDAYRSKDFMETMRLAEEALEIRPGDAATTLYLKLAERYTLIAADDTWDGTLRLTRK